MNAHLLSIETSAPLSSVRARSGRLTIDLGALASNYRLLRDKVKPAECTAVVKANAYGLGVTEVVPVLLREGCRTFFTATCDEAIAVRALAPHAKVVALYGLGSGTPQDCTDHNIIPVINTPGELSEWQDHAARLSRVLPLWLHVDTGMSRAGLGADEWAAFIADPDTHLKGLSFELLMSHFACADDPENPKTRRQYELFQKMRKAFPGVPASLCNSPGIFSAPDGAYFQMVRPGMAIYGLNPQQPAPSPMRRVVTLELPVMRVWRASGGETVSYGATYECEAGEPIASVLIGYADGFSRKLSNKGELFWNGHPCPIVGRVTMDVTMISLKDFEGALPVPGDLLEAIGPHQSADALATTAGTIDYKFFTGLGARYERVYIDEC